MQLERTQLGLQPDPMTPIAFYRAAIWLPVIASGAAIIGIQVLDYPLPASGTFLGLLVFLGYFCGIPYTILAAWATYRLKGSQEHDARRLALRMPLFLVPLSAVYTVVLSVVTGDGLEGGFFSALLIAVYILPIGYVYVGLVFILRWACGRMGCFPPGERKET